MVSLTDLMTFLQAYMGYEERVSRIDSYLANGLQVAGQPTIHKIATGVSANLAFFEKAQAAEAQALLVHHSMNPPTSVHFEHDSIFMNRLKYLWRHNLSLIGYHYLLDSHPEVGHNVSIIRALGGEPISRYGGPDGWGWLGEIDGGADLNEVLTQCRALFQDNGFYYPLGSQTVRRIVCLTGSGAPRPSDYPSLIEQQVDLFITGEPREWNRELCREAGISMVAGGHYNTEIIGLTALSRVIQDQFEVEIEFIDIPNEV
jgi:dinuclear metal center YbgI/SA1388 family protein